jgi:hypothetical protein
MTYKQDYTQRKLFQVCCGIKHRIDWQQQPVTVRAVVACQLIIQLVQGAQQGADSHFIQLIEGAQQGAEGVPGWHIEYLLWYDAPCVPATCNPVALGAECAGPDCSTVQQAFLNAW